MRHVTITIQDSSTWVRTRVQTWSEQIHLTHYTYSHDGEQETEAPSFSKEGAQTLANLLWMLTEQR